MIITSARKCPICGGSDAKFLHMQKFMLPEGHPLSTGYDVVCCIRCGFVYADTIATQEDYECFYATFSKYEDQRTSTGGGETPWDAKRLRDMARQIATFVDSTQAHILDMGCANGGLLKALGELGFKHLCGVDPSPTCVANVRQLGVEAHVGSLSQCLVEIRRYDCVILSHVLEHVQDLKRAIQSVRSLIKLGGSIYVEVPDATRYAEYLLSPFQDFNAEHINHFSGLSLSNLMQPQGFTLKEQGKKLIESSASMPYPAVYGFYIKVEQKTHNFKPRRDNCLPVNMRAYIARSQVIMDGIDAKLRELLKRSPQVILYGTGQLAMKLLVETSLANARIAAFVDGNPVNQGKKLRGIPILLPDQIRETSYPIIVTTILHQQEITRHIQELGLSNKIILLG